MTERSVQNYYFEILLQLFDVLLDQDTKEIDSLKQTVIEQMVVFSSPQLQILRFRELMNLKHLGKNVFEKADFYKSLPNHASTELKIYMNNY